MINACGKILIKECDLNLKMMLSGGQSFRWKEVGDKNWIGVAQDFIWNLTQYPDGIEYKVCGKIDQNHENILKDYLRIEEDINDLYADWSAKDRHFESVADKFKGIRLLNQNPVENLFSFICSSNNNIVRISSMVDKMCSLYGQKIGEYEGTWYYSFPKVKSLTGLKVEDELRKAGFGYRAKYIHESAKRLEELGGEKFLENLKTLSYSEAKAELVKFCGIGPKVADCICLMSLGHLDAIPVDTHVFQIARENYIPSLKSVKSVTDKIYNEIGDCFRDIYGKNAGWAHLILFCADLRVNKTETKRKSKDTKKSVKKIKRS